MIKANTSVFASMTDNHVQEGIDLRTWMATQFMAKRLDHYCINTILDEDHAIVCAKECLIAVDALIAELNKTPEVAP